MISFIEFIKSNYHINIYYMKKSRAVTRKKLKHLDLSIK